MLRRVNCPDVNCGSELAMGKEKEEKKTEKKEEFDSSSSSSSSSSNPRLARFRSGGQMSMVAGEFVDVYGKEKEKGAWGAVVTCFFLDTGENLNFIVFCLMLCS